jgi:hypothetical protein
VIAKLVKAGYLWPALRHDADAITAAIARLKQDLRSAGGEDGGSYGRLSDRTDEGIAQHRPSEAASTSWAAESGR